MKNRNKLYSKINEKLSKIEIKDSVKIIENRNKSVHSDIELYIIYSIETINKYRASANAYFVTLLFSA